MEATATDTPATPPLPVMEMARMVRSRKLTSSLPSKASASASVRLLSPS